MEDAKGYFSYISLMCCLHMQAMLACERNNERDEGQGVKSKSKIPKKKQKVKLGRGGCTSMFLSFYYLASSDSVREAILKALLIWSKADMLIKYSCLSLDQIHDRQPTPAQLSLCLLHSLSSPRLPGAFLSVQLHFSLFALFCLPLSSLNRVFS